MSLAMMTMLATIAVVAGFGMIVLAIMVADWRESRRQARMSAMRRHPSARTTMSDREKRYHSSDQWGR